MNDYVNDAEFAETVSNTDEPNTYEYLKCFDENYYLKPTILKPELPARNKTNINDSGKRLKNNILFLFSVFRYFFFFFYVFISVFIFRYLFPSSFLFMLLMFL